MNTLQNDLDILCSFVTAINKLVAILDGHRNNEIISNDIDIPSDC
jgi:hypothetical protein